MKQHSITQACQAIVAERISAPQVAIVLGSGLGGMADQVLHRTSIPYSAIPGFPCSTAQGHAGKLHLGFIGSMSVAVMQGRCHLYEGHSVESITFPLRVLRALGAETLILSNASGGLNPGFSSGDVVVIDDHIDWMFQRPAGPSAFISTSRSLTSKPQTSRIYDPSAIRLAHRMAAKLGLRLQQGTYLGTLGPCYETRAEYRFFRRIGADMVGMSTVPEALLANQIGFQVIAFSVVTNVARPDCLAKTSHIEVLDWADRAQKTLVPLVREMLESMAGPPD